jgi:hypothetical protein
MELFLSGGGIEIDAITMVTIWKFLEKFKVGLPYDPAFHLWMYKEIASRFSKRICLHKFITAGFTEGNIQNNSNLV